MDAAFKKITEVSERNTEDVTVKQIEEKIRD